MKQQRNGNDLHLAPTIGAGILLGALVEIVAALLGLYKFQPWWISLAVVFVAFGLGLGSLTYILRSRPIPAALLACLFAFAAETANAWWLEFWVFDGWILASLPTPIVRAGAFSLPVLIAPFLVRALAARLDAAQARYRRAKRIAP